MQQPFRAQPGPRHGSSALCHVCTATVIILAYQNMQRSDIHDTTDSYTHDTKTDENGYNNISKTCTPTSSPNYDIVWRAGSPSASRGHGQPRRTATSPSYCTVGTATSTPTTRPRRTARSTSRMQRSSTSTWTFTCSVEEAQGQRRWLIGHCQLRQRDHGPDRRAGHGLRGG